MDVRQKMYNSIYGNPNYRTELMAEFSKHVTENVTREMEMQFKARKHRARTLLLWIVGLFSLAAGTMLGAVIVVDVPAPESAPTAVVEGPGEGWERLDAETIDALRNNPGGVGNPAERAWEECWISYGDTTYIVCPDGYAESS